MSTTIDWRCKMFIVCKISNGIDVSLDSIWFFKIIFILRNKFFKKLTWLTDRKKCFFKVLFGSLVYFLCLPVFWVIARLGVWLVIFVQQKCCCQCVTISSGLGFFQKYFFLLCSCILLGSIYLLKMNSCAIKSF